MKLLPLLALAALLLTVAFAGATTPQSWATATPGLYLPACTTQSPKHWEVEVGQSVDNQVTVFDAFRNASWSNIRLRFDSGSWIMSADCSLAS